MKDVILYTDGACSGNPGAGGYATILRYEGYTKEITGGFTITTNNRMELMAIISGLEALHYPCNVWIYTDSKYVVDAVMKGWVYNWKRKGWVKSDGSKALNPDLWDRLLNLMKMHKIHFEWVKGHSGIPENERCDKLAKLALKNATKPDEMYLRLKGK